MKLWVWAYLDLASLHESIAQLVLRSRIRMARLDELEHRTELEPSLRRIGCRRTP